MHTGGSGFSRRRLLGLAAGGAVAAGGTAGGFVLGRETGPAVAASAVDTYPFLGVHQAGIITPAQGRMHTAAFDVTSDSVDDLVSLLRRWTAMAARLTQGDPAGEYGPASGPYDAPPDDTGEAMGLSPSGLTLTFGFGRSIFVSDGADRFGLADRLPAAFVELPHFPQDALEPARCGGDLIVQACADDPQVAVHAIRNLSRTAFGTATIRWSQLGYGRTSSTSRTQETPRNLFGFKDGTANVMAEDSDLLAEHVWVRAADAEPDAGSSDWMTGGSYLAARRIRMIVETWDRTSLGEQEAIVGRTKGEGAPLSGGTESSEPDFALAGRGDVPLIAPQSHLRLAHPSSHGGAMMLRRGYNYTDGSDELGRLDAGLFFVAFVRDPRTHYIPVQNTLSREDVMMEYLRHTGSGLFAVPPGVPEGSRLDADDGAFVGAALFRRTSSA